ncbi:MAG: hypothetical protein JST11_16460, partial [Acidobacteria bacterium]|nr:hypothetical protein [Acidobacteriota bacterium]
MFKILKSTFDTGLVTIGYPDSAARIPANFRGAPRFDFARWPDPRPAAEACPTGALSVRDSGCSGIVTMDYGLCTYCGECAAADSSGAVRMTGEFELAALSRRDLVITAEYGAQGELIRLERGTLERKVRTAIRETL